MTREYVRSTRLPNKLAAVSLVFLTALSCFSVIVPQVKADTYNQVPLLINVMEGAAITGADIDEIERRIDNIWSMNGLNWRVTSIIWTSNYQDPNKGQDQPGDVREGPEEGGLYGKGEDEVKNKPGFKVFVVNRILNGTGHDVGYLGGAVNGSDTAVIASNDGGVDWGAVWAHEIGHLFGLDHQKQNGTDRPEGDLMYPYAEGGVGLQGEDVDKMNKTKQERGIGYPEKTDDQWQRLYNMYRHVSEDATGDSEQKFTDIGHVYFAFYMLDATREFHITTHLEDVIPDGVGLAYSVALDTDNDPTTGGEFAGWQGIDLLIVAEGTSPNIEAVLYSYPGYVPITPLETRIQTHFKYICTREPPARPREPIRDSIVISVPLQFLGSLSDPIRVGSLLESVGTDRLEIMSLPTSPPPRPSLTFEPSVAPSGTVVTAWGSGYTPFTSVSIIFDHINLTTTEVGPTGFFQTTFMVPELPPNHYMVDAIDTSNQIGVRVFTITTYYPPGVPVFPIGLILEIALIPILGYLWWKRKQRKLQ